MLPSQSRGAKNIYFQGETMALRQARIPMEIGLTPKIPWVKVLFVDTKKESF
jgi:hypothetical protein